MPSSMYWTSIPERSAGGAGAADCAGTLGVWLQPTIKHAQAAPNISLYIAILPS
jgi:hypothetical protein